MELVARALSDTGLLFTTLICITRSVVLVKVWSNLHARGTVDYVESAKTGESGTVRGATHANMEHQPVLVTNAIQRSMLLWCVIFNFIMYGW